MDDRTCAKKQKRLKNAWVKRWNIAAPYAPTPAAKNM
jgi:hypothetical protein